MADTKAKVQRVDFEDGKYSICVVENTGYVYLLRNGEQWFENPQFAKMFIAIAYD